MVIAENTIAFFAMQVPVLQSITKVAFLCYVGSIHLARHQICSFGTGVDGKAFCAAPYGKSTLGRRISFFSLSWLHDFGVGSARCLICAF